MLGQAIYSCLSSYYDLLGVARSNNEQVGFRTVDCLDLTSLYSTIIDFKPDVIINAIALVDLNKCEENYSLAYATHKLLSDFLSTFDAFNIYISTDSVFDGSSTNYTEKDSCTPINNYAKTKLLGESPIIKVEGLVIRTNIYGFNSLRPGNSILEWGVKELSSANQINGFTDVVFNPVSVWQLSHFIKCFLDNHHAVSGILNVGSDRAISKYEFLTILAKELGVDESLVKHSSSTVFSSKIKRPKNTVLSDNKLNKLFSEKFTIEAGIKDAIERYRIRTK